MISIRVVLGVASSLNLKVEQLDMKEELYMEQPKCFKVNGKEELLCTLKKILYRVMPEADKGGE